MDSPRLRYSAAAVAALFFVNGATFSNWLPRIPEIRDELGLGNAGLGATLLGGGLGGIFGALVVGKVMDRLGSRRVLTLVATSLSIGMPLIAFAPNAVVLLVLLTTLGVLDVCNDVAMNAQGVIVQQRLGRSIMNRLHAMWSLGFTAGALIGSGASAAGAGVRAQLLAVGAVMLVTVTVVRRWLIPIDPPPNAPAPTDDAGAAPPKRFSVVTTVMALAALGAVALEVMPNDWSAVLMRDEFDFGRASGFGTMACAGAMLIGRLGGDHVLDRIGERRLFTWAITLVGIGTLITATAPVGAVALIGLVVWGLGLSVVFPQLVRDSSASARGVGRHRTRLDAARPTARGDAHRRQRGRPRRVAGSPGGLCRGGWDRLRHPCGHLAPNDGGRCSNRRVVGGRPGRVSRAPRPDPLLRLRDLPHASDQVAQHPAAPVADGVQRLAGAGFDPGVMCRVDEQADHATGQPRPHARLVSLTLALQHELRGGLPPGGLGSTPCRAGAGPGASSSPCADWHVMTSPSSEPESTSKLSNRLVITGSSAGRLRNSSRTDWSSSSNCGYITASLVGK